MEALASYGFLALPTIFITLCLIGGLLALRWRCVGTAVAIVSGLCLFAAATPALSSYLLHEAEAGLPRRVDLAGAQAIVVLGGDLQRGNGRDIPDRLGPFSRERLVFAAAAYRRLHLPVAVSGGAVAGAEESEAALMQAALERDFGVPVAWAEGRSRTTWENAVYTAQLLGSARVRSVVIVTHAWHLQRAVWTFERVGLKALPWPAPRTALQIRRPDDFLPSAGALLDSFHALHEIAGGFYYRLRH